MINKFDSVIQNFLVENEIPALTNYIRNLGAQGTNAVAQTAETTLKATTNANPQQAKKDPVQSFADLIDNKNTLYNTWDQFETDHPDVVKSLKDKGAPLVDKNQTPEKEAPKDQSGTNVTPYTIQSPESVASQQNPTTPTGK